MRGYLNSICFSLLCIAACVVEAQERKGVITGSITDSAHAILQGASVDLQPGSKKAVSDNTGQFSITDVVPGNYTLNISFVGMAPYSKEITVTGGQPTRVEVEMQVASASESVTVTAERVHGEAEAINRERTAENILQVLPAEIITSLPNANVADAIGRLPSVTLAKASTCRSAGPSRATATSQLTASMFRRRRAACGKSSWTPSDRISLNRSRSTKHCWPIWMPTASADR
jgi:hypothetical protein